MGLLRGLHAVALFFAVGFPLLADSLLFWRGCVALSARDEMFRYVVAFRF